MIKIIQEDISNLRPEEFSGKDFSNIDFSGRCLVGANFSNSICKECNFSNCDLSHAIFRKTDLYKSKFNYSILYATEFTDSNLTWSDFTKSYLYGILINGFVNITYANLLNFQIENLRRKVTIVNPDSDKHIKEIEFMSQISDTEDLCKSSYRVGNKKYSFDSIELQELSMQKSQIYHRLKRLFHDNHFEEEMIHCLYHERYHLTRSFYKYSTLTGETHKNYIVNSLLKTFFSFISEKLTGYGLKPILIIRNCFFLFLIFTILSFSISKVSNDSGIIYEKIEQPVNITDDKVSRIALDLGKSDYHFSEFLSYSTVSILSFESNNFTPYGSMKPITFFYTLLFIVMIGVLASSIFIRLIQV